MPVRTRRWNDPQLADDGLRLLVSRFRPRALPKDEETWEVWWKELGPSVELHAAYYGKTGPPISFEEYAGRYLREMDSQQIKIHSLARHIASGQTLTLLCSSACTDPSRCHRTLLAKLITEAVSR